MLVAAQTIDIYFKYMVFPLLSLPLLPGIFLLGFQAQMLSLCAMIPKGRVNHFYLYILMAISI